MTTTSKPQPKAPEHDEVISSMHSVTGAFERVVRRAQTGHVTTTRVTADGTVVPVETEYPEETPFLIPSDDGTPPYGIRLDVKRWVGREWREMTVWEAARALWPWRNARGGNDDDRT